MRSKYLSVSPSCGDVLKAYMLLSIGVRYSDFDKIPADLAENLITLHSEIKDYEAEEMKRAESRSRR